MKITLRNYKFVTNTMNLATMATMGVIAGEPIAGERSQDSLSLMPGFIPLIKKIPKDGVDFCSDKYNNACVVHLKDTKMDSDSVYVLKQGEWQIAKSQTEVGRAHCVLVVAPLSLSAVKKVSFVSQEHKTGYERYINSDPTILPLDIVVDESAFGTSDALTFAEMGQPPAPPKQDKDQWRFVNALFGVWASIAKVGYTKAVVGQFFCELVGGECAGVEPVVQDVAKWFRLGGTHSASSKETNSFLSVLNALVYKKDIAYSAQETVIRVLTELSGQAGTSVPFIEDLISLNELSSKSVDTLLKENEKRAVRKAIVLFFSQPDVWAIWQYNNASLEPLDRLLACILLGVSQGWQAKSTLEKTFAGNNNTINDLIARASQKQDWQQQLHLINLPLTALLLQDKPNDKAHKLISFVDDHFSLEAVGYQVQLSGYSVHAKGGSLVATGKKKPVITTIIDKERMLSYLDTLGEDELNALLSNKNFMAKLGNQ